MRPNRVTIREGRLENLVWVVKMPDNEQMFKLLQLLYDNIVNSQQQLAKCSQMVRFGR